MRSYSPIQSSEVTPARALTMWSGTLCLTMRSDPDAVGRVGLGVRAGEVAELPEERLHVVLERPPRQVAGGARVIMVRREEGAHEATLAGAAVALEGAKDRAAGVAEEAPGLAELRDRRETVELGGAGSVVGDVDPLAVVALVGLALVEEEPEAPRVVLEPAVAPLQAAEVGERPDAHIARQHRPREHALPRRPLGRAADDGDQHPRL
mmetsp:Transcript_17887/g.57862  ORF Transcript_17887/g.57862 Transcript_17887/m.57862 type:complete len:208 (+) Transcript_17887:442-1065(+)